LIALYFNDLVRGTLREIANSVNSRPIVPSEQDYPRRVIHRLGEGAPAVLYVVGDASCLSTIELALLCSVSCPGSVIIKTFDAIRNIRDAGVVVAGGFHSPMERDCLHFLLRGSQHVVLSPAHTIEGLAIDSDEQAALNEGRLVAVSVFDADVLRPTPQAAVRRNQFVAATADTLLVPHAVPGGKVEREAREAIARGQKVLTFDDTENSHLVAHGATAVPADGVLKGMLAHRLAPRTP
jgi:predicted Rossmann fold nucleotide-binding protein DprA/Smf involved in DNA uptake